MMALMALWLEELGFIGQSAFDVPFSRRVFCWCAQALYPLASAFRDLYCRHGPDEGSLSRMNTSWLHVWCSADACFRLHERFNAAKARPGLGTRSLWRASGDEGNEGDEGHEGYESHEGLWCGSMQCFVMWGRRMLVGHEIHEEVDEEG